MASLGLMKLTAEDAAKVTKLSVSTVTVYALQRRIRGNESCQTIHMLMPTGGNC